MAVIEKDLGPVSAYAVAVAHGYTGTEAEWEALIANSAINAQNAGASATAAAASAQEAAQQKTQAQVQAAAALAHAQDASRYSQTAGQANSYAQMASSNAAVSAANAGNAQTAAEAAQAAAEAAVTGAEAAQAAAEAAVTDAETAKTAAETAAASAAAAYGTDLLADDYSTSKTYAVGDYCIYSGSLYRCTTAITTGEAWTAAHWTKAQIGPDVNDLKSAFVRNDSVLHGDNLASYISIPGDIRDDGTDRNTSAATGSYKRSDFIPVLNGDGIKYDGIATLVNYLTVAVYNADKTLDSELSIPGNGSASFRSGSFTMNHDGYVRFCTSNKYLSEAEIHIYKTDANFIKYGAIPDSKAVRDQIINDGFANIEQGLYAEQYDKTVYNLTWSVGGIRPNVGDLDDTTTKHIRTSYIPIYSDLPISIDAPDNIKCIVYKYNKQSYTGFVGSAGDYKVGKQRAIINSFYIKIVAMYTDETDIDATAGSSISVAYYVNNQKNIINFISTEVEKQIEKTTLSPIWQQGTISTTNGSPEDSNYAIRTGYIKIKGGSAFTVKFSELYNVTIHEYDRQSVDNWLGMITTNLTTGYFSYSVESDTEIRVVLSSMSMDTIRPVIGDSVEMAQYFDRKDFNILVIGNSFSQDSFAYLPPVLNEVLPEYNINYGVAYRSSASISDHVQLYNHIGDSENQEWMNGKYTSYWEWSQRYNLWKNFTSTGQYDRGKTIVDILALRNWDVIYVQPTCAHIIDANYDLNITQVESEIINPGRQFLRILQSHTLKPFTFLMGEWMGVMVFDEEGQQVFGEDDNGKYVFLKIAEALQKVQKELGIDGIIPIGAAIQDARTNPVFQQLGIWTHRNMLIGDGIHMQSGIAPLMAAYTIAKYILRLIGMKRGLYGSSFVPTTENCEAIKAYKSTPPSMTHLESVGVTTENIRAAQEICTFAVNYPDEVVDCSNVIIA